MKFVQNIFFGLSASIISGVLSGVLFAKPIPTKYGEMQNGHVTAEALTAIKADSEQARLTLEPARYASIVKDPSKATTDAERIAALAAREIIYLVDRSGSMSGQDDDPTGQQRKNWTLWNSAFEAGKSLFEIGRAHV